MVSFTLQGILLVEENDSEYRDVSPLNFTIVVSFSPHERLLTLLILAVHKAHVTYESSHKFPVAQAQWKNIRLNS